MTAAQTPVAPGPSITDRATTAQRLLACIDSAAFCITRIVDDMGPMEESVLFHVNHIANGIEVIEKLAREAFEICGSVEVDARLAELGGGRSA